MYKGRLSIQIWDTTDNTKFLHFQLLGKQINCFHMRYKPAKGICEMPVIHITINNILWKYTWG